MNISCLKNYSGYFVSIDGINEDNKIAKLIGVNYKDYTKSLINRGVAQLSHTDNGYYFTTEKQCEKFIREELSELIVSKLGTDELKINFCYHLISGYCIIINGATTNDEIAQILNMPLYSYIDHITSFGAIERYPNEYYFLRIDHFVNCVNSLLSLKSSSIQNPIEQSKVYEKTGRTRKINIIEN